MTSHDAKARDRVGKERVWQMVAFVAFIFLGIVGTAFALQGGLLSDEKSKNAVLTERVEDFDRLRVALANRTVEAYVMTPNWCLSQDLQGEFAYSDARSFQLDGGTMKTHVDCFLVDGDIRSYIITWNPETRSHTIAKDVPTHATQLYPFTSNATSSET